MRQIMLPYMRPSTRRGRKVPRVSRGRLARGHGAAYRGRCRSCYKGNRHCLGRGKRIDGKGRCKCWCGK